MSDLVGLSKRIERITGKKETLEKQRVSTVSKLSAMSEWYLDCETAQQTIQMVAEQTQKQLEYKIGELVTLALRAIFPEPYDFKINFTQRRGTTEADLIFELDGHELDPMTASGGGVADVASFALRISLFTLQKSRPTIVLDEPFKFVSTDLQESASALLKELSVRLGIQFIIVTHEDVLIEHADKVFYFEKRKKVTRVEVHKDEN